MQIRLFAAGGVGLMFLSALVIGLAVGLTRKDSPPAVNAVSFKPDDWEKVNFLPHDERRRDGAAPRSCVKPRWHDVRR